MKKKLKKKLRQAIHKIHLWVGLAICIPAIVVGVTGSILVFQDSFLPDYELAGGEAATAEQVIAAAASGVPAGKPTMYMAAGDDKPATVRFKSGDENITVWVDPVSLAVLSVNNPTSALLKQVLALHSSFLIKEYGGRSIVGWFGVAMLVMGLSGLVIWWPKKGKLKKSLTVKKGAKGLRLYRDLHQVFGIWGFAAFLLVTFSGVYMCFPKEVGAIFNVRDMKAVNAAIKAKPVENIAPIGVDEAIAVALAAVPESKLLTIMLPGKLEQPYRLNLAYEGYEPRTPAVAVFVDPWSQQVLAIQDPRSYAPLEKFVAWQHAIHEGSGFGWIWRILVFMTGISALLFSITGVLMWWIKRKKDS